MVDHINFTIKDKFIFSNVDIIEDLWALSREPWAPSPLGFYLVSTGLSAPKTVSFLEHNIYLYGNHISRSVHSQVIFMLGDAFLS